VFSYDEVPNYSGGATVSAMPLRIIIFEDFEDAGGWTDHTNLTSWTQTALSGHWRGDSYVQAVTFPPYVRSGSRAIYAAYSGYYLYLPVVNYPYEVSVWCRVPVSTDTGVISLLESDGFNWYIVGSYNVTGTTYTKFEFKFTPLVPQPQLRLHFGGSRTWLDDVEVRVAP